MDSVFVSSIQRDFEDVREEARRAIESLGMRPLMAETAGARAESPQGALLDLVRGADIFLLLVGPRYSRATEDEFDEARRHAKPILVLRQRSDLEPKQVDFLDRVAGSWKGGRLWGEFDGASDVALEVVKAISNLRRGTAAQALAPETQERATEIARGSGRSGNYGHGSSARVGFVPVVSGKLLDAVALDEPAIGDTVADLARAARLVPHSIGIAPHVSAQGITIELREGYSGTEPLIVVGTDGAIGCEFSVGGSDQFGSMRVDPDRLAEGITAAGRFALAVWDQIDEREQVQQVAVAVCIPGAQHKVFGKSTGGSSIQMGSFSMPSEVLVPQPTVLVRRAEVGSEELVKRLVAEARRVFADAGAVQA